MKGLDRIRQFRLGDAMGQGEISMAVPARCTESLAGLHEL